MSRHHDFKVIDRDIRQSYHESDLTTTNVRSEIALALEGLAQFEADTTAADKAASLAVVYNALTHLDRWIPRVPDAFACGYFWGGQLVPPDDPRGHWSTFSAHATREEAEAWLPYWQREIPSQGWLVEQRPVKIYDFVKGGPPA